MGAARMKAGDLVQLSAYGSRIKMNRQYRNSVGLVTEFDSQYAITVIWQGSTRESHHIRNDLKFAK